MPWLCRVMAQKVCVEPSQTLPSVYPLARLVKNPPAMQETWVRFLGWEDPLKKGKTTYSSILAWKIPGLYSPWGLKELDTAEWLSLSCVFFMITLWSWVYHFQWVLWVVLVKYQICRDCRSLKFVASRSDTSSAWWLAAKLYFSTSIWCYTSWNGNRMEEKGVSTLMIIFCIGSYTDNIFEYK